MKAPAIEWLQEAASTRPADVAVHFGDDAWTFDCLAQRVLSTAAVFREYGIEPGSRAGLVLGNGPEFVTSLLGILALGATAVPLNPLYRSRELNFHARANAMAGIITAAPYAKDCAAAMQDADLSGPVLTFSEGAAGTDISSTVENAVAIEAHDVQPNDIAVVLHTAGSTGKSKLVPRRHMQLQAECDSFAATAGTNAGDVIFGMLPLYHCHGLLNCLFAALRAQCRLYLFANARPIMLVRKEAMAALEKERVTIFPSIPFQLERLLLAKGDYDLSALRLCFTGGAALSEETYREFKDRFGVAVRQQYGCTEAGAITLNLDEDADSSWSSVGKPLAGVSVSILDADESGNGEIAISTDALTTGYEHEDKLNADTFVDGVFRTGDMGRLDDAGNLHVTQRRPVYIDVAGHKIDSVEVEDVLREFPDVIDVMVVGTRSDPVSMKAVIACTQPPETSALREFCRPRLASYKIPSIFEFRDAMPDAPAGQSGQEGLS
jgi:long-chain acyl-CoA synthetase